MAWLAQIALAILFARAMATSILGFRANIPDSQDLSGIVFRTSQFRRDIAPMIKSRRISACPAFDIRPSRSFPPRNAGAAPDPARPQSLAHAESFPWVEQTLTQPARSLVQRPALFVNGVLYP